ncbi:hypothetical protein NDU88_004568, partial [Pleurodeles waltl]
YIHRTDSSTLLPGTATQKREKLTDAFLLIGAGKGGVRPSEPRRRSAARFPGGAAESDLRQHATR